MAHIRREIFEIISTLNPEALKQSHALEWFNYCEQLYQIEKELREHYISSDDYYDERHTIRLKKSAPIFKKFQEHVDAEIVNALPKSPLGRAIKPFVMGRKNWMFSKTIKGAKSSEVIYSIVEIAKTNGLEV